MTGAATGARAGEARPDTPGAVRRFRDGVDDPQVLREATDLVMDELGGYVAELRAVYPSRWDRRIDA